MGKLVIVSNRVALPGKESAGGLAVAMQEALAAQGGVWCGWSGRIREYPKAARQQEKNIDYLTFDLTQKEYDDFYVGFSNSLLWPLFHYRLDMIKHCREMYDGYDAVNCKFAESAASVCVEGDLIWVQDYQLLTVGHHLRKLGVKERLGFFLHIPFPVPEVFLALPMHRSLLESLCMYDLIGFQTDGDLQAFLRCVNEIAGGRKLRTLGENTYEVQAFGRKFKAGCFPISIDTQDIIASAEAAADAPRSKQLEASLCGRQLIIGVDRLDYTKGLPQRLEAFNSFLSEHPEYYGKVSYIQITPTSRTDVEDYRQIRETLEAQAAHINGEHGDIDWVPIRYINKSFSRTDLAGFYRMARVGLVTPLRDGMNLVAKEYVASQNPEDPGVLILSRFAGAAQELEAALLVNPFEPETMATCIRQALDMPLAERKRRHHAMLEALKGNDIYQWTRSFLHYLQGRHENIIIPMHGFMQHGNPAYASDKTAVM